MIMKDSNLLNSKPSVGKENRMYIVIDRVDPCNLVITTDEEGNPKLFNDLCNAAEEVAACQDGLVVEVSHTRVD